MKTPLIKNQKLNPITYKKIKNHCHMGFILELKGWSDIKIYQTIHHINRAKKNKFTHTCTNCTEEPIQCIKART